MTMEYFDGRVNYRYEDIGHDQQHLDSVFVWVWSPRGVVEAHRANRGTHETFWGKDYINLWRGRIELTPLMGKYRISIAKPQGWPNQWAPSFIVDALKDHFYSMELDVYCCF